MLPLAIIEGVLALHVLLKDFVRSVPFEQRPSCEDNVEDDSRTKDISLAVVALFLKQLGGNIAWRATPAVQFLLRTLQHVAKPKSAIIKSELFDLEASKRFSGFRSR